MSVTKSCQAYFTPFFRDADDPKKHCLIGKWTCNQLLLGDGTGGEYMISVGLNGMKDLFGNHAMWDIQFLNSSCIGVAVTLVYWQLQIIEYTSDLPNWWGVPILLQDGAQIASARQLDNGMMKMKWKDANIPGAPCSVAVHVMPNTNGVNVIMSAGGYVYDERYLDII
jgi:hypothetical protein